MANPPNTRLGGASFVTSYPLECVQIDHTKVNVILVDELIGSIAGRFWITVAIDVFSRTYR